MDPITSAIITGIIISTVSGIIIGAVRRKWKKNDKKNELTSQNDLIIKNMRKDIWRLNKTVLIMAKIIDDQTEKNHPELNTSLEDIATELLGTRDK